MGGTGWTRKRAYGEYQIMGKQEGIDRDDMQWGHFSRLANSSCVFSYSKAFTDLDRRFFYADEEIWGYKMDDIIQKLRTPEECMQLEINVRDKNPELARKARRRSVELRAAAHGSKSNVELELLKALYAYEEVLSEKNKRRTRATRTWQMIDRHGIIGAAERAVNRNIEAAGYKLLAAIGLHDLTFEAVIVRHPEIFSQEVIERAKERLGQLERI